MTLRRSVLPRPRLRWRGCTSPKAFSIRTRPQSGHSGRPERVPQAGELERTGGVFVAMTILCSSIRSWLTGIVPREISGAQLERLRPGKDPPRLGRRQYPQGSKPWCSTPPRAWSCSLRYGHTSIINALEFARTIVRPRADPCDHRRFTSLPLPIKTLTSTADEFRAFGSKQFLGAHCRDWSRSTGSGQPWASTAGMRWSPRSELL